jgi:hypothetical protein
VRVASTAGIRLRIWLLLTLLAFVSVLGWQLVRTHYSNACDPGLARFNLMKQDPAVQARPKHAFSDIEVDQPDNGPFFCTNTTIQFYVMGFDNHAVYQELNQILESSGWTALAPASQPDFELYQKQSPNGLWSASVSQQLFWTEMWFDDYGGPATTP